jgi:hypothetical protein
MTVEALQKVSQAGAGLSNLVEANLIGFFVVKFEVKLKKNFSPSQEARG